MSRYHTLAFIVLATSALHCTDGFDDSLVEPALAPARFPHDAHVTERKLACGACHHETEAAKLTTPHPSYLRDRGVDCSACHHEASEPRAAQACTHCHHDSPSDVADESSSAKVVIHQTCWRCHPLAEGAEASSACEVCHFDTSSNATPPPMPLAPHLGGQP